MRGKEGARLGLPGLFLALDQHADIDGEGATLFEPGARRLEEGHQLAFVVGGAAGDDDRAIARILGQARLERRRGPFIQADPAAARRNGRRTAHAGAALAGRRAPMPDHHRLAQCRLDPRVEADLAQRAGAAFRRFDAGTREKRGRSRRWDRKQSEQPLERRWLFAREPVEHAVAALVRRLAARSSPWSAARGPSAAAAARKTPLTESMHVRFECRGELFAHLHVDGLRTLATAVRLGLEGYPRTLVERGKSRLLQRRDMQKHILAAIVRRDKAEPS